MTFVKGEKKSPETRRKIALAKMGSKNPQWKGGKILDKDGYIWLREPNHPFNHNGYVRRARFVMEKHIGRLLKSTEIIHHINEIKTDDRIENLKLLANLCEHRKLHNPRQSS